MHTFPLPWADHPYACALKDESGVTRIAWGSCRDSAGAPFILNFRQFFSPRRKAGPSPWDALPLTGTCSPENHCRLEAFPAPAMASLSLGVPAEIPVAEAWDKICAGIEERILAGEIAKAVPARSILFELDSSVRERLQKEIFQRLFSGSQDSTYRFLLKWEDSLFFGATPELLFRKDQDSLFVPAIAGTRPLDPGHESEAERDLLESEKEQREHRLVVEGILDTLASLGLSPEAAARPQLLRLRGLVHLFTPIKARHHGLDSERLIESLHPTPAIGGHPKAKAVDILFEKEPLDRGLFSGPLLFREGEIETCLVAIRSGLLQGGTLRLFAGAGYVEGSSARSEWKETGRKMDYLWKILEEERK